MQSHKMSPILRGIPTIYSGKSGQRLHRGEQQHIADGRRIGEQHHHAVHTESQPARGRQPVFQRGDEILIHFRVDALGLAQRHLLFKALALVDGVVQFREGVAHFGS